MTDQHSATDPYDEGMRVRRAVLGDDHVDRAVAKTDAFTQPVLVSQLEEEGAL